MALKKICSVLFLLFGIVFSSTAQYRVFTIGDSTVQDYNDGYAPRKGWGQMLSFFFDKSKVTVTNKAIGGTSSKSFYENHWKAVRDNLRAGDYVFIQFGINDRNGSDANRYAPGDVFKSYIKKFVDDIRAKKAIPVLVTTVRRCAWTNGKPYDSYHEHPQLMRDMASTLKTPLIDLDKFCYDLFVQQGELYATRFLTMNLEAGEYSNYPKGNTDQVHYQEMGATENARFVVESIEKSTDADLKKLAPCTLPRHQVTITINDKTKSKAISRSAAFPEGINITLKTIPQTNAKFLRWEDGSRTQISNKSLYVLKMGSKDVTYKAVYESDIKEEVVKNVPDVYQPGDKTVYYFTDPAVANYATDLVLPMLQKTAGLYVVEMDAQQADFKSADADLIVISEVVPSTAPAMAKLQLMEKPTLNMKVHGYKNATGAWKWATAGFGDNMEQKSIVVEPDMMTHPIFNGIDWQNGNELQLLKSVSTKGLTYMNADQFTSVEGNAKTIASIKGEEQTNIIELPAGTVVNGTALPKTMLQVGINSSSYANLTSDGEKLLQNCCFYLLSEDNPTASESVRVDGVKIFPMKDGKVMIVGEFTDDQMLTVVNITGTVADVRRLEAQSAVQIFDFGNLHSGVYLIGINGQYIKFLKK